MLGQWGDILKLNAIPDEKLYIPAYAAFNAIKLSALMEKHDGFREEKEWRVVYLPEHDPEQRMKSSLSYVIGSRGVEPKLKFKVQPIMPGVAPPLLSLPKLLDRIILGPSVSSPLARMSFLRMLEHIGKSELKTKVFSSSIPLRPLQN